MKVVLILGVLALTAALFFGASQTLPLADGKAEVESLTAQIDTVRADFTQQETALKAQVSDLDAKYQDTGKQLQAMMGERDQLAQTIDQLKTQLAAAEAKNKEFVAGQQDGGSMRAEVEALTARITDLTGENSELTTKIADLQALPTRASATPNDQIAALEGTIDQQKTALAAAQGQVAELTQALGDGKQAAQEMAQKIASFETESQTLTEKIAALTTAVAERETALASLQADAPDAAQFALASCREKTAAVMADGQVGFIDRSASIDPASTAVLERIVQIAAGCTGENLSLDIEGHTDNSGGDASRLLLSTARATAVRDFLVARGVAPDTLRTAGYGDSDPIADNETAEGQARNQRIVFDWNLR